MTPDAYTIREILIEVGGGHTLYVQEWGNPAVKTPIVFLHGGPGGSVKDGQKELFDPKHERVVFFDQRGCGKSLPWGSLEHNTTQDLVEDIEKIARRLKLDQFMLTGGSWGSCLALAYTLKYPQRAVAMVLNGIFTGTQSEIDWLDKGRFASHFPDIWNAYLASTPKSHHANPSAYHFGRVLGGDEQAAKFSAYTYENVEAALLKLDDRYTPEAYADYNPGGMKLEIHYLANRCFLADHYILDHAAELTMPLWLVQGRYDMVCPPVTAYELHKRVPGSNLIWTVSGHKTERESWTAVRTILLQLSQEAIN